MDRSRSLIVLTFALSQLVTTALSASLTPDQQKAVRAGTFEVVLKKLEVDPLKYEKPPPLDLIPFVERNDAYWSIGTAFALSADTYASAAHVLVASVNSQFGAPALRDAAGHVHPVDRVLKFSPDEDFAVFTLAGAAPATPLPTTAERKIDDPVFAVGNALGEGIVIRDGLLTSETPEPQDGRWKWLRFSAAASPGNSGGPLLDSQGRVIGIVRAKSPNENLNYGVPIELVQKAPPLARFDSRYSIRLPNARASEVATLKTQFALPLTWNEFSRRFRETYLETTRRDMERLQTSLADAPFPKGNATKMLAVVYESNLPGFVQQTGSDEWDVVAATNVQDQDLSGHGLVRTGTSLNVGLFRVRRPDGASDVGFYRDPTALMDLVLRGAKLTRPVGDQMIRIVSLGKPLDTGVYADRFGRHWSIGVWPLSYTDSQVLCYWLPTPEGAVGMIHVVSASQVDAVREWFKALADAFYTDLSGTLTQWQVFLAHPELRPASLEHVKLQFDDHQTLRYASKRIDLQWTSDTLKLTPQSELELRMAYFMDGERPVWDVGAVYAYADADHRTFAGAERHVRPRDESAKQQLDVWNQMHDRGPGFNGMAGHDEDFRQYWIHQSVSAPLGSSPGIDPQAKVLYDVFYHTERASFPMDLEESERRLLRSTHILER